MDVTYPEYDETDSVHRELASAVELPATVAASVDLSPTGRFVEQRTTIRNALVADGIAVEIEALVMLYCRYDE